MNLIFVFFLNLLLFNGHLMANISQGEIHSQNTSSLINRTEIRVLNEDFPFSTFYDANLEQVIEYAKSPLVSDFVKTQFFPAKYHNYMFYIVGSENGIFGQAISEMSQNQPYIYDHNLLFDMLKSVGNSIHKIGIINENFLTDDQSAFIQRQVNEYCSDSLEVLSLGPIKENTFAQYTKPFSNLKSLYVSIVSNQVRPSLTFNELFPRLQQFVLGYNNFELDATKFLGGEIPHIKQLEHLKLSVPASNRSNSAAIRTQQGKFLQVNSHIRKFTCMSNLDDFIQVIKNNLPNLDYFTIWELDPEIQPVQLDQVKHFNVLRQTSGPVERISLPNLQSVTLSHPSYSGVEYEMARISWKRFFKNHPNLKELNCGFNKIDRLVEFFADVPNLEIIGINSFEQFNMDLISQLIEGRKKLLKFYYQVYATDNSDGPDMEIYREQFGNEWNVTLDKFHRVEGVGRRSTLTFERIN